MWKKNNRQYLHIKINLKSSILHLNKIVFDEEMKNAENCVMGATSPFVYLKNWLNFSKLSEYYFIWWLCEFIKYSVLFLDGNI